MAQCPSKIQPTFAVEDSEGSLVGGWELFEAMPKRMMLLRSRRDSLGRTLWTRLGQRNEEVARDRFYHKLHQLVDTSFELYSFSMEILHLLSALAQYRCCCKLLKSS